MKTIYLFAQKLSSDYLPRPSESVGDIVNIVFVIFGAISVLMVTYAGFQIIISNGNADKVATARRNIIYVLVGLIVASLAWTIVNYVVLKT